MKYEAWDRTLWGVALDKVGPLGTGWESSVPLGRRYPGEPGRALLFATRALARAWCQNKHAFYATYPDGHTCRAWHFRVVRVRERLEVTP